LLEGESDPPRIRRPKREVKAEARVKRKVKRLETEKRRLEWLNRRKLEKDVSGEVVKNEERKEPWKEPLPWLAAMYPPGATSKTKKLKKSQSRHIFGQDLLKDCLLYLFS
jgi:aminoglycoside phosphotransferase